MPKTRLQILYRDLSQYLAMIADLDPDDAIVSKIEGKCKSLVEAIKKEQQNIFD
jgi:hypothetical protein